MNKRQMIFIVAVVLVVGITAAFFLSRKSSDRMPSADKSENASLSLILREAKSQEEKGKFLIAKAAYQKLVADFPGSGDVLSWQKKIEDINIRLLFSNTVTPGSALYEIKAGDNLTKIAREFKTTPELIEKSNGLSADKIIPGRKIKVWKAPFSILVDKSQNMLILKAGEEVFKTYTVSTGTNNSTPVGTFKIVNKLPNPTWFKAGAVVPPNSPENVLGSRWMGFDLSGYGIHGTTDPQSLGKQATQGCIRLSNPEVEEVYIIVPVGIEVTVVD